MADSVSAVSVLNIPKDNRFDEPVNAPKCAGTDVSIFHDKNVTQPEKQIVPDKLPDEKEILKTEAKNNSFLEILKKVGKGAISGIAHVFAPVFSCPPMAMAVFALVGGLSCGSTAVFGIMLAALAGILSGGALSGIVFEFQDKKD